MPMEARANFQEELKSLEEQALGGLEMARRALDRTIEAVEHQDIELAALVIAGMRLNNKRAKKNVLDEIVEKSLRGANLWKEVKDRLNRPASGLSGGQQQRLCIARAIAVKPQVLLMDEPCSALDPISTLAIEDLMAELKDEYTIVIVTHNMQQAARVSDRTGFFNIAGTGKPGHLIEMDDTEKMFSSPSVKDTEDYISGRFG